MSTLRTIRLSDPDIQLLKEALDSHVYWQLSDQGERNNGYVSLPDGCDDGACADDCETPDEHQEIRDCETLAHLLDIGGRQEAS